MNKQTQTSKNNTINKILFQHYYSGESIQILSQVTYYTEFTSFILSYS